MRRRRIHIALALAGVVALAAAPADAGGGRPQKRTVKVADNFFSPDRLTVARGTTLTWRWPEDTGDTHDVTLTSGPSGVRKWQSEPAAAAYSFRRRLSRPGLYKLICTFHEEEMRMQVRVRR